MQKFQRDPAAIAGLTPEQFRVTQKGATEMPGTGETCTATSPASTSIS